MFDDWPHTDFTAWWDDEEVRGSFASDLSDPGTDPNDSPSICIQLNAAWQSILAGCALQVAQPATWTATTQSQMDSLMERASALVALVGLAGPCANFTLRLDLTNGLQLSNDGGATWVDVTDWLTNFCTLVKQCTGVTPPPTPPGQTDDQYACNIAGYIVYSILQQTLIKMVDTITGEGFFADAFAVLLGVIPGLDVISPEIIAVADVLFSALAPIALADLNNAIGASSFWQAAVCALYNAMAGHPVLTQAVIATAAASIALIPGIYPPIRSAIAAFLAGIDAAALTSVTAGAYAAGPFNCTTCSSSGTASGPTTPSVITPNLTVEDGTNYVRGTSDIHFVGAVVSGTAPDAVVTITGATATGGLSGSLSITILQGAATATATITFAAAFASAPALVVSSSDNTLIASVDSVTTSGATVRLTAAYVQPSAISATLYWAAGSGAVAGPQGAQGPQGPAGAGVATVSDGTHTVLNATELLFTSGATVTDAGGGLADVAITGGGGGGSTMPWDTFTTPPSMAGWTWANQSGAAIASGTLGQVFTAPGHSGDNVISLTNTPPGGSWTLTACFNFLDIAKEYQFSGIALRDATNNKTILYGLALQGGFNVGALKWTGASTYSGDYGRFDLDAAREVWLRVHYDGTNFTFSFSPDNINWYVYATEAWNNFLGALTGVGIGMDPNSGTGITCTFTVMSWAFS